MEEFGNEDDGRIEPVVTVMHGVDTSRWLVVEWMGGWMEWVEGVGLGLGIYGGRKLTLELSDFWILSILKVIWLCFLY